MELVFDRDDLGQPPDEFSAAEKQAWADIVEHTPGVLELSDSISTELAAGLLARARTGGVDAAGLAILHDMLDKCFMTPEGKQKLGIPHLGPRK